MKDDRTDKLRQIRDEIWNLSKSPLYEYRIANKYHPVLGQGSHYAKIVMIGEAPGTQEAESGYPFVGQAGKILDRLFESIDLKREDVYLTNIVKDRPPDNRNPKPEEIEIYGPYLLRQINIIKPKIIVTLGKFPMEFITKAYKFPGQMKKISQSHGQIFQAIAGYGGVLVVPLYHPAVAAYNPAMYKVLQQDFKTLKRL
ncbi:uracil-DNA glycosylase [Candidatus Dojkabacteria bacterium]|nr:uracil-DNA glycosylase [Candidatus Dojkabacteria bacterium]